MFRSAGWIRTVPWFNLLDALCVFLLLLCNSSHRAALSLTPNPHILHIHVIRSFLPADFILSFEVFPTF